MRRIMRLTAMLMIVICVIQSDTMAKDDGDQALMAENPGLQAYKQRVAVWPGKRDKAAMTPAERAKAAQLIALVGAPGHNDQPIPGKE